jgi:DNA-directed RNA polymerase
LGSKIIEIVENSYFIKKRLVRLGYKDMHYELNVHDENLKKSLGRQRMYVVPNKLPMIVEPKNFDKGLLGGYLLNDVEYKEGLFIPKKAYSVKSEVEVDNNVYSAVNNISKTPFKINTELLDYITSDNKHSLLLDPDKAHENTKIDKKVRTKTQDIKLKSYNSKVLLQETILEIANFYRQFNKIYFPIRLCQRGRFYCTPNYFNYQSNELSKSLILFSNYGIIKRNDTDAIAYLKSYGANCFGGRISKSSISAKQNWVNRNVDNILDYDNGVLLAKASDKLLFLAFCMEFKRFYNFHNNESSMEFETYLPIQLDASCNGFKHIALLSEARDLYAELNLKGEEVGNNKGGVEDVDDTEPNPKHKPKDFYAFLLNKVVKICQTLAKKPDQKFEVRESYERLCKFV